MNTLRREDGQVTVLAAVFIVVLLGMAGFVIDVGSWFRQQRAVQTTVDSAALAGVQALPGDPVNANALATTFAGKNGGVAGLNVTIKTKWKPNDMITVTQTQSAAGFFSKLFGVNTATLSAKASAVTAVPSAARFVAPIVVNIKHPDLSGPGCPCFNAPTTLDLGKTGAPGAFTYDKYLPLGQYFSDPGAKWNNSTIQAAMQARYGTELLFPVYDQLINQGSNAEYHIIGWASFHLTDAQASGTSGTLTGYFTQVIWTGLLDQSGPSNPEIPDLGVHSVALVD